MLFCTKPKLAPPIEIAIRKIEAAAGSLSLRYDSFREMWVGTLHVTRKDGVMLSFDVKSLTPTEAICGLALKLMRERLG